jgi:O-antigen ligase
MTLARQLHRLRMLNPKVEFFSILTWLLFFPWKGSHLYFLVFALLIVIFSLRNIFFMKNLSLSSFFYFLAAFNLVLILSVFFSLYRLQSILWVSDIFLISLYFILFFLDKSNEDDYFHLLVYLISLMSLLNLFNDSFSIFDRKNLFFSNPIFQGVASGIAVLILFYYILEKFNRFFLGLLILNVAGVFISESKAAYIGTAILILSMALLKKRKLIPVVIALIALTFITANPIKKMFIFSLTKDPYATNRLDMWKMSLDIFKDHLLFGVGPDNFREVSKRYNFKQAKGPANYFKQPHRPHNDYFKILTETGIAGLIFLLLLGWVLAKKIFSSSLFNLSKLLLLYLLFQAFVFNLIFHIFFFFIFLFLLKNLFEQDLPLTHKSFTLNLKTYYIFLLVFAFMVGHLLPYLSHGLVSRANKTPDTKTRLYLLNKAAYLDPLDADIHYLKALSFHRDFKETAHLGSFYSALESLKKAQWLNRYLINAYGLESDLYYHMLQENMNYSGLPVEIIRPLAEAEQYDPLNPFIKLRKAELYLQFNRMQEARQEALQALELEPDYAAALYFLHKHFHYFPENSAFEHRMDRIREKIERYQPEDDTYLDKLFKIPGEPVKTGDR